MHSMSLPPSVQRWRDSGAVVDVDGRGVFVRDSGDRSAPVVLILHGFPSSSYDWVEVVPRLTERARVVTFDMLGYGLSAKPTDARFSLFEQADLAEAVADRLGVERCTLVAHDMGDTVAAELLHRFNEGRLDLVVDRAILTNGSIFIDMAQLSDGQQLLLSLPDEPLQEELPLDGFRPAIRETFSAEHPPSEQDVEAMLALIRESGGDRLLPRLIRYITERRQNQDRWTAALVDYAGPLTLLWGDQDPIAVVEMTDRMLSLRESTEVVRWGDVGHWPSIEVPDRVADEILKRLPVLRMEGAE